MKRRWLILADDLTGAADCAIAFAKHGMDAVVSWGAAAPATTQVLSVDADSRRFPAKEAAARQIVALTTHWQPGMRLYKKIDSTLRGQPMAELAVQLRALEVDGRRAPLAVVAPAFPATGRVTLGGRILVGDLPLEQTPLWARDHTYSSAHLGEALASAGLTSVVIDLDVIRRGVEAVHARLLSVLVDRVDAVVCDCTAAADLAIVAEASLRLDQVVWVGSAGLATALAEQVAPETRGHRRLTPPRGPVLTVVGSLAEASRLQARVLADAGLVRHILVAPATLEAGPVDPAWKEAQLALAGGVVDGVDMLLEIALAPDPDLSRGPALAGRLAALVEPVAPNLGGLVATGGDTACALLSQLGVKGIRLIDEVEPGVPLGLTQGAQVVPVVTKAGAFGDAGTLRRCLERLKS
ncbi:MAG: four-carbon acid sugar kinase family protein [Bacteroidota bacterium]